MSFDQLNDESIVAHKNSCVTLVDRGKGECWQAGVLRDALTTQCVYTCDFFCILASKKVWA